ncbi:MAG: ChaN family lipoprotein [Planctomycetota bacterium]
MRNYRITARVGIVCAFIPMCAGCDTASRLRIQTGGNAALFGQFRAFDGQTGQGVSFADMVAQAGNADVVLFGEEHSDVVCNALEAQLLTAMAERGRPVSLAMEFFENDTQGPLDAYLAGRIEESDYRKLTRQKKAYLLSHRPLIEFCRAACVPVIAANAPTRLTRALRLSGKTFEEFCATTQPSDRAMLPARSEMLEGAYFDRFKEAMSGHETPTSQPASQPASAPSDPTTTTAPTTSGPSQEEKLLRSYRSQSMWDDAMSEAVAIHRGRFPDRRVMLVIGGFHVQSNGGTQVKFRQRRPNDRVMTIVYRGVEKTPLRFDESDRGAGDVIIYGVKPPDEDAKPATPTSQPTTAPASQRAESGERVADLVDTPDWSKDKIQWKRYKRDRAHATVNAGYTVFIDYTADWCANSKTMLKTAIETPDTIAAMKQLNVVAYSADYTLPVPEIKDDLDRYSRGGVPVFVVYRPGDTNKPELLPEIISTQSLVDALKRAGPSQPKKP